MKKFFIKTYGCTANSSASELMTYLLKSNGYEKVNEIIQADFALINTCIVKAPTESKIKSLLKKLYMELPLIVTGCFPQIFSDWCKENIPKAILLGVDHFSDICQAATNLNSNKNYVSLTRINNFCTVIQRERFSKAIGIIEISKGCNGHCTYCIVRQAKGPLVSKSTQLILAEASQAIEEGCKELWLTAQDTASYGIDANTNLPTLLQKIISLPGDFMVRVGMMNADIAQLISNDLIDLLNHPKMFSFLHIPLQSGSNVILQKMNRNYSSEDYINLIKKLKVVKNLTLSTDVIVGFPGETDEDFAQTKKALSEIQFDIVNISKYGDRAGTIASKSNEKLPTEIIKKRSSEMTKIVNKMTFEKNNNWIGWMGSAVVIAKEKEYVNLMRNKSYKLIAVKESSFEIGGKYNIRITNGLKTRLIGENSQKNE